MTYVIAQPCVDLKDRACVDECPVDCIYEGKRMLYIHPDECVDCGACEPVCPVEAIFYEDDTPEQWKDYYDRERRLLRRPRLARRRRQDGRDRQGPPAGRGAPAAVARRVSGRRTPVSTRLPDFPWDHLTAYAAQARARTPTGSSTSRSAPRSTPPRRSSSAALAGAADAPGLPAHDRAASRPGRPASTGWPGATASPDSGSTACCRSSAPRS